MQAGPDVNAGDGGRITSIARASSACSSCPSPSRESTSKWSRTSSWQNMTGERLGQVSREVILTWNSSIQISQPACPHMSLLTFCSFSTEWYTYIYISRERERQRDLNWIIFRLNDWAVSKAVAYVYVYVIILCIYRFGSQKQNLETCHIPNHPKFHFDIITQLYWNASELHLIMSLLPGAHCNYVSHLIQVRDQSHHLAPVATWLYDTFHHPLPPSTT